MIDEMRQLEKRVEQGFARVHQRMDEGFTHVNRRIDDTNKRIDETNIRIDETTKIRKRLAALEAAVRINPQHQ